MSMQLDRATHDKPWQFSLRGLLWALTVTATFVGAVSAVATADDIVVVARRMMAASIVVTAVLGFMAWRRMRERNFDLTLPQTEKVREKFAFYCGLMSVLSYGSIWLMILIDRFESRFLAAQVGMNILASLIALLYPLILLALLLSLVLFWGWRKNPPLLAMRLVGLFANTWLMLAVLVAIAGSV